ncbi:AzlC family ABC transporter permease [Psychrobacter sp. I-STPA10]|uniref:AzlC family ABC transporter permease n=1 Tax=Psychrobacter sp. I-STPA10 TaxID=2585769 RepID=UPI001E357EA5|nr:AzlC family ABC transporter permease [Psychrobacter sp. I-STPA10]
MTQSSIQSTPQQQQCDWQQGFHLSLPVAMGYLPAGIAFGVLAQVAGLPLWASLMMSLLLYAGAAQYACLPMLSAGLPVGSIATNIAAINMRHLFYALPLLSALPQSRLARIYCLFALTDETFSVMTSLDTQDRQKIFLPISLFNQGWWVIATLLGAMVGGVLNDWIPHLDFALVCLFAVLAYEQFKKVSSPLPIIIAVMALLFAHLLTDDWILLTAISLCIVLIVGSGFIPSLASQSSSANDNE